jgi:hypothetical protein
MAQIKKFKGLNNVSDNLRLAQGWLTVADNIEITDTGGIVRREGYGKTFNSTKLSGVYTTLDFTRMYAADAGALVSISHEMERTRLCGLVSDAPMYWAEINSQVFFSNGVDSGIVLKDGEVIDLRWPEPDVISITAIDGSLPPGKYQVCCTFLLPDGRETGSSNVTEITLTREGGLSLTSIPTSPGTETVVYISPADSTVFQEAFTTTSNSMNWVAGADSLGADLITQFYNPLPRGTKYLAFWGGRLHASQYFPESDTSVVWGSEPLGFHLFDLSRGYLAVPGEITMLAPHDAVLLIGTTTRVYTYDQESLTQIADYGAVPGWNWVKDDEGKIMFWTTRGLCSALPFSNLTLRQIGVDSGVTAGAAIIQKNGTKKYVVALQQGGINFNKRGSS